MWGTGVCTGVGVPTEARALGTLELELQGVVSHLTWVL